MTTIDFITELFCRVDDQLHDVPKHSQASLYPSEVVTLALLFALKGVGNRAFYRWLSRDYRPLFPHLPERTRLFRLFNSHRRWTARFMAQPTLIGLIDTYGIELLHPRREGRSPQQIGKKGLSNKRWIVGCKLCFVLNHLGLIVDWAVDTANVYDGIAFQEVVERNVEQMVLFADEGFLKKDWHPDNLKICQRGEWNSRMIVETVLSMLTLVSHLKKVMHRKWAYLNSRLAYTMAMFNMLVQWDGLEIDEEGAIHFHLAPFSL
ncbi:MAG: transposase [Anaerolineae bacterium]